MAIASLTTPHRLRESPRTALPRRRPGFGGAWLQRRDDIDHDWSVGGERLLEGRGDLARLLDTDAAHAEAAGDLAKIGRPEADQCLAAVRTIARNPVHASQVWPKPALLLTRITTGMWQRRAVSSSAR